MTVLIANCFLLVGVFNKKNLVAQFVPYIVCVCTHTQGMSEMWGKVLWVCYINEN